MGLFCHLGLSIWLCCHLGLFSFLPLGSFIFVLFFLFFVLPFSGSFVDLCFSVVLCRFFPSLYCGAGVGTGVSLFFFVFRSSISFCLFAALEFGLVFLCVDVSSFFLFAELELVELVFCAVWFAALGLELVLFCGFCGWSWGWYCFVFAVSVVGVGAGIVLFLPFLWLELGLVLFCFCGFWLELGLVLFFFFRFCGWSWGWYFFVFAVSVVGVGAGFVLFLLFLWLELGLVLFYFCGFCGWGWGWFCFVFAVSVVGIGAGIVLFFAALFLCSDISSFFFLFAKLKLGLLLELELGLVFCAIWFAALELGLVLFCGFCGWS